MLSLSSIDQGPAEGVSLKCKRYSITVDKGKCCGWPCLRTREIAARGEAIYRERIQSRVGSVEKGNFVVIDIETGDYEIDSGDAVATRRLLDR